MTVPRHARWLGNRHAQTIWGALLRRPPPITLTRELWILPDGDELAVSFTEHRPGQPGVVLLHGLEGSVAAPYLRGLLARVNAAGWNGCAFDFRGCGRPQAPARGLYHAGKTDDLSFVVERLRTRWPAAPLGAVGFSLGGNMLLKWLGETGSHNPLTAAVAISVPFDLAACAEALDGTSFFSFIYRERFLRSLRKKALAAVGRFPKELDAASIRACRTFAAYDGAVVARLFGFTGAQDYWSRCSAQGFLAGIRRPTRLVASADDPFVPVAVIPRETIAANPALSLVVTQGGGHVAFVGGTPFAPRYLADDLAIEHLAAHFPRIAGDAHASEPATLPSAPG